MALDKVKRQRSSSPNIFPYCRIYMYCFVAVCVLFRSGLGLRAVNPVVHVGHPCPVKVIDLMTKFQRRLVTVTLNGSKNSAPPSHGVCGTNYSLLFLFPSRLLAGDDSNDDCLYLSVTQLSPP